MHRDLNFEQMVSGDLHLLLEQSRQMCREYDEQEMVVLRLMEIDDLQRPAWNFENSDLAMPGPISLAERLLMEEEKLKFLASCRRKVEKLIAQRCGALPAASC